MTTIEANGVRLGLEQFGDPASARAICAPPNRIAHSPLGVSCDGTSLTVTDWTLLTAGFLRL
jgi:hypothetical protein